MDITRPTLGAKYFDRSYSKPVGRICRGDVETPYTAFEVAGIDIINVIITIYVNRRRGNAW